MKRSRISLIAICSLLAMLMIFVIPAMAENVSFGGSYTDVYETMTGNDIWNEGYGSIYYPPTVDTEVPPYKPNAVEVMMDNVYVDYYEGSTYETTVRVSGAPAASFIMELELPWFVNVENVYISEALTEARNAVSDSYFAKNYISIAYSSADDFENTELFTIEFSVNTFGHRIGNANLYDTQFVNGDAKEVDFYLSGGEFNVHDPSLLMGDVDLDGSVALDDVMYLLRYLVGRYDMEFSELQFFVSDIDRDNEITMIDCQYIQNYLVGKIDSLENIKPHECEHYGAYEVSRSNPTCSDGGYIEYYCPECGEYFVEEFAPTGRHKYDSYGYCRSCGIYNEDYDTSIECTHDNCYTTESIEPEGCYRDGYDVIYCNDCDEIFIEIIHAEHAFDESGNCLFCGANPKDEDYSVFVGYINNDENFPIHMLQNGRMICYSKADGTEAVLLNGMWDENGNNIYCATDFGLVFVLEILDDGTLYHCETGYIEVFETTYIAYTEFDAYDFDIEDPYLIVGATKIDDFSDYHYTYYVNNLVIEYVFAEIPYLNDVGIGGKVISFRVESEFCEHNTVTNVEGKDATCGEDGYYYFECTSCGTAVTKIYYATGNHEYNDYNECINCGKHLSGECKHHNAFETDRMEPTCNESGFVEYYCPDCGAGFGGPIAPTYKHVYNDYGYCYYCGKYNGNIEECDHEDKKISYQEAPTCGQDGYIEYYCPDCNLYFEEYLSATGKHSPIPENPDDIYNTATCVDDGERYYYCEYCYNHITIDKVPATGIHDYSSDGECYDCDYVCPHDSYTLSDRREPTCLYNGYTIYICDECEYVNSTLIETVEHQFGEDGTCSVCGAYADEESNIAYITKLADQTDFILYKNGTAKTFWYDNGEPAYGYWKRVGDRIYVGLDGLSTATLRVTEDGSVEILDMGYYLFSGGKSIILYFDYETVCELYGTEQSMSILQSLSFKTVYGTANELSGGYHYIFNVDNFIIDFVIVTRHNETWTSKIVAFDLIEKPCAHESVTEIENIPNNCGDRGTIKATCNSCGIEIITSLPATGDHKYDDTGVCTVCGECQHLHYNKVYEEAPNCTGGHIMYECTVCGDYFSESLPSNDKHTYSCNGECVNCGEINEKYIDIHKYTCYGQCIYCDKHNEEFVGVHTYDDEGYCEWCGEHDGVTAPCEHENAYETGRYESTCMNGGGVDYHCPDCGVDFGIRSPATVPHKTDDYGNCVWCGAYIEEGRECTHEYDYYGTCVHCGEYNADYDMSTEECEHYNAKTVVRRQPTCINDGLQIVTCPDCGLKENQYIPATGKHEYDDYGYCAYCGEFGGVVEECRHEYNEEGYCYYCGEYNSDYAPEIPEVPSDKAELVYEYTAYDGTGVEFYADGSAQQRLYAADGSFYWVDGEWSMTDGGIIEAYFNGALYRYTEDSSLAEKIPELIVIIKVNRGDDEPEGGYCEHNYTFEIWEPTCIDDGSMVMQCVYCDEMTYEILPATGKHTYENGYCIWCGIAEGDDEGGNEADHIHYYENPNGTKEGPFVCIYCGAICSHPNLQKYVGENGHGKEGCPDCPYANSF